MLASHGRGSRLRSGARHAERRRQTNELLLYCVAPPARRHYIEWMEPAVSTEVLIVGAGPTGLVLALWLARRGIKVRIIDKNDAPSMTSRALAVQARTLEL